jgi:hypothetical protein
MKKTQQETAEAIQNYLKAKAEERELPTNFDPAPHLSQATPVVEAPRVIRITPAQSCDIPECKMHHRQEQIDYECKAAGYQIECRGSRCRAHIITRQLLYLKLDKLNILDVCKAHETYFNKRPLREWYAFVRRHYPKNFEYLYDRMHDVLTQLKVYIEAAED